MNKDMERNPNWRGGRGVDREGYIVITVAPKTRVKEHRLVMEKFLGRKLSPEEVVHHKDGDKANNSIENLVLTTKNKHCREYHRKHDRPTCHPERKHFAFGLCGKCYQKRYHEKYREERLAKARAKYHARKVEKES